MADRPRGNYRGRGGRNGGRDRGDRQRRPQDGAQGRDREWGGDRQRRPQAGGAPINAAGIRYWTRDEIPEIAKSSPAVIVQKIQDQEAAFLNAYSYERNYNSMFVMHKLIKILNTLCNSSEVDFVSRRLSQIISDCAGFMMKLKEIVMTTDDKSCLQSLVNICRFCTEKIPQTAIFKLPHSELKDAIEQLEDPPLTRIFEDYCKQYDMKKEEMKKMRKEKTQQPSSANRRYGTSKDELQNLHSQRPPNNFREIEVLPQASEFGKGSERPFLRPVIIKDSYQNWDHYLDVQFRLLREDFMSPLRDGIHEFLTQNERNKSVHLYFAAKILEPICLYSGIGFNVKFDINASRLNRVRWEHSRRLIFGSLLCMSCDHFKTILFASVVKRDPDQLKNGYLTVKFEGDINGFTIDPATQFTMVESTAYFEAYRHVLEGLQQVTVDQMPFTQHIIGGFDYSNPIPLPLCIRGNPKYDLNRILELKRPIGPIDVSRGWPHIKDICLDESQLKAFKMALSQQVSVLQGPPGTGKTYIAKKIVKAMLQNRSVWDPMGNSPILVVCYTNHALDQFLEGIIARGEGITDVLEGSQKPRIVRVGGRCKSEELKECAMANLVNQMKRNREVPGRVYRDVKENRITMKALANKMEQNRIAIDAMEGKLLTVDQLEGVINDRHHQQLKFGLQDVTEYKHIEVWLGLWLLPENDGDQVEEELDEEEQLAAALEATEEGDENRQAENQGGVVIEGENANLIDVIDEPQVLQNERMIEGDVVELGHNAGARGQPEATKPVVREKVTKKGGWEIKQLSQKERKDKIKRGMRQNPMNNRDARNVLDIWGMEKKDKWRLYQYWLNQYIRKTKGELQISGDYYNRCAQQCIETDQELNKLTLANADIVGMTTTGAAKHSYIFKNFHPKILIVEEAAEVLESHVVTSLCASVEQMVLIGDHKQLQPKITCFDLEKYDLHVSLFERLAMKGFPIATLSVQHRMRPEIASIVGNHVYEKLENHKSVLNYEHVKGVGKDLFFIEHAQPEKTSPTGDQRSHANPFEADYVVSLTRHLLKQGYQPGQITILTMYRGQLFEIKQKMTRDEFGGVRVTAVDDFQGEENDIVIISLVRSNNDGSIGFLKVENRICVSLSRAKEGMYVIGNFAMLRDKKDTIWPKIIDQMEREGYLGEGLPLCCQIHTQEKIIAKTAHDFSKSPEGGCRKQCGARLDCGHMCMSPCHPLDSEHKTLYRCQQNCGQTLPNCNHKCARRCYDCLNGCPPCEMNVSKKLPYCGHDVRMRCCDDPSKFQCNKPCDKRISNCGHKCQSKCSQPCTPHNLCQEPVPQRLSCNHITTVPCSDQSSIECQEPCNKKIDSCQHDCKGTCGKCSQGRLHVQCKKKCGRPQNCGHLCDFPCPEYCPPCSKPCGNYCFHSKCPKKCYEPCVPCREPCKWECRHHKCTKQCGEKCNRPPCDRPCYKILKCGHPCIGLCGEDCPSLCRICDKDEVTEVFFGTEDEDNAKFIQLKDCVGKHVFEVSGLDQWMETQSEAQDSEGQSVMVKFVECPKCKTPIRRSLRYGNIIKTTIANMEEIKILNMKKGVKTSPDELFQLANSNTAAVSCTSVKKVLQEIVNRISSAKASAKPGVPPLLPLQMSTIENQINLLPKLAKLFDCLKKLDTRKCQFSPHVVVNTTQLVREATTLLEFLKANDLNPQQARDAECELRRLFCLSRACQMKYNAMKEGKTFNPDDEQILEREVQFYSISGTTTSKATPEDQERTDALLLAIMRKYSIGGLSASERLEIVRAISGVQKGAWYKCPKGHIYAIGDCGGATEVGKCPECGSRIGGTGHQLTAGNVHAGEMDGSQHAAWSEAANLANFDQNQLDALFR